MFNIHTKETINVTFKRNGKFVPEALQALNHFMRDWRRNQETKMDPALIDLIWEIHNELGSKEPVHLICGYRSPATNEMLRRTSGGQARNSRHITGQAADIVIPDVPLKQLRYSGADAGARRRGLLSGLRLALRPCGHWQCAPLAAHATHGAGHAVSERALASCSLRWAPADARRLPRCFGEGRDERLGTALGFNA